VAVEDPSRSLLAERPIDAPGSAVVAAVEGSRPILVEVQALLRALGSSWLAEQLGSLSGYDAIECGRIVDSF
jgi:predicted ATP-dependent serine protease